MFALLEISIPLWGQTLEFKIIKISHKRGNVVLSRRAILEKERENFVPEDEIKEGSIVKGFVKNITDYGAFIDLGNMDGLLHITDMSWSRVTDPNQIIKVGRTIRTQSLKIQLREK